MRMVGQINARIQSRRRKDTKKDLEPTGIERKERIVKKGKNRQASGRAEGCLEAKMTRYHKYARVGVKVA